MEGGKDGCREHTRTRDRDRGRETRGACRMGGEGESREAEGSKGIICDVQGKGANGG